MTERCVTFRADGGYAVDILNRPATFADVVASQLPNVLPDHSFELLHPMVEGRHENPVLRVPEDHAECMSQHVQHIAVFVAPSALNNFCFVHPELFLNEEEEASGVELYYEVDTSAVFDAWAEAGYPNKWDVYAPKKAKEAA